jgi:hypothetical protein
VPPATPSPASSPASPGRDPSPASPDPDLKPASPGPGAPAAAPAGGADAGKGWSPTGVWLVEKSQDPEEGNAPGVAWIVTLTSLTIVKAGKVVANWPCQSRALEGGWAFACSRAAMGLMPAAGGKLLEREEGSDTLARPATASEAARLTAIAQADAQAAQRVCDKAKRCCAEAMPLLGGACGKDELPRWESVDECTKQMSAYKESLAHGRKPAPASCR